MMEITAWSVEDENDDGELTVTISLRIGRLDWTNTYVLARREAEDIRDSLSEALACSVEEMRYEDLGLTDPDDIPF